MELLMNLFRIFAVEWLDCVAMFVIGTVSTIHLLRHGLTAPWMALAVLSVGISAALLRFEHLRRSELYSQGLQTVVFGVLFTWSLVNDTSAGLLPIIWGYFFAGVGISLVQAH